MIRALVVSAVWASALVPVVSIQSGTGTSASTEQTTAGTAAPMEVLNGDKPRASALASGWVRTRVETPVRILRDPQRSPLAVLHAGTKVRVRDYKDRWLLVEFDDKRWGKRLGWVLESQCEW